MAKTIVVLPGSNWQIPIIEKCKSLGHRTLVVNPYEDSPAFPYADGHLMSDIFDFERVCDYCRTERADAIISEECDIAMPLIAKLGKALQLPALTEEDAHLFTDKFAMREFCRNKGLPSVDYKMCYNKADAVSFLEEIGKKIIIKPLDSNSSRGVFTVETKADIEKYFDEALSYSKVEKAVLAERFIEGIEFTIDGIKTPKGHYSLAISEKRHFKHNMNIASDLFFTHKSENFDYDLLREVNDRFVNESGLSFGLTHAEYKCENGVFYLIEIAARGGGNLISSDIVPFMSGIDNYKYLIECCLGNAEAPDFTTDDKYIDRSAVLKFFDTPAGGGRVERIEGMEILSDPRIIRHKFNFEIGDVIEPAKNDAARVGFYIACCENRKELEALMDNITKNVKIICK